MDGSHSTENFPTLQQELNATVTLKVILGKFDLKFVIGNQTTIVLTWDTGISDIYNVLATRLTGYIQVGKLKTRKSIDSNYFLSANFCYLLWLLWLLSSIDWPVCKSQTQSGTKVDLSVKNGMCY